MKLTELLKQHQDKVTVSFEFIPPKKGISRVDLIERLKPLMEFNPLFVDVTTHRDDIVFTRDSRVLEGYSYQRHPSTLVVCESIRHAFPNTEVIPHILCGGFSKQETEDILLDFNYLGYDNVVALTGDKLSYEKKFIPHPHGNKSSVDLISQISDLNKGVSVSPASIKTDFCIGAACYPECHYTSPNQCWDDRITKNKVESGAEFLISQMCFSVPKLLTQKVKCDSMGVHLIPGIKVLTSQKQLTSIPNSFFVEIPTELEAALYAETHMEFAVDFCKDLITHGMKHLHFYTMNSSTVLPVLKELF